MFFSQCSTYWKLPEKLAYSTITEFELNWYLIGELQSFGYENFIMFYIRTCINVWQPHRCDTCHKQTIEWYINIEFSALALFKTIKVIKCKWIWFLHLVFIKVTAKILHHLYCLWIFIYMRSFSVLCLKPVMFFLCSDVSCNCHTLNSV